MRLMNQALSGLARLPGFHSRGRHSMGRLAFAVALALALGIGLFTGQALAATYMGTGYFSASDLNWRYYNPNGYSDYAAPASSAIYSWHTMTDLNLTEVYDGSWHTLVKIDDWGDTEWAGKAYICSAGYGCDSQSAWDHTYSYAIAQINHFHTQKPFYQSYDKRKSLITHETGHTWSLDHVSDSTSIMRVDWWENTVPNSNDVSHINTRY